MDRHSLFTRRNLSCSAFLAVLALCLQLVASGISGFHAAQRLASNTGAIEICTPAGIIRITENGPQVPDSTTAGQNCQFCGTAGTPPPLLAVAISFFLPTIANNSGPSPLVAGTEPSAPDLRHAPSRAPPSLFV